MSANSAYQNLQREQMMSGRVLIDVARTRVLAALIRAAKRVKTHLSERLHLMCEAAAEEKEA